MIFHFQLKRVRQETQTHPRLLRPGVPRHIVQRFLQDAVNVHAGAAIHRKRRALFLIGYGNSGLSFYGRNVPVERALESGLVEHHRMQRLRKAANALQSSLHDLENFLQISTQGRTLRSMRSSAPQHRTNGGENLSEFIVQFARNVTQRGFLRGNQLLRQFAAALGNLRQAREQPPVPANQRKSVQQNRQKSCGQKNIDLPLHPVIDLNDALAGLLLILAVLHQQTGPRPCLVPPAAPASES